MNVIKHITVCVFGIVLLLGVPFLFTDGFESLINGTDAVSSASEVVDAPSGRFTVLINREMHKDESDLAVWNEFFSGGEFGIIFDDIACVTLSGDESANVLAHSFMSRLPENQMTVTVADPVFAVSKADCGRFDMMIVSDEAAELYALESVYEGRNVDVIRVSEEGSL